MPHLLSGSAYTYVRHCLRASVNGASASAAPAVPVNGFGVHLRETLCWGKSQRSAVKCLTCRQIWCTPTWNTLPRHVPTDICKCCTCQRIWHTLTWNTALAQVPTERLQMLHLSADLAYTHVKQYSPKYQWSVCKCCTCQRIWRTLMWKHFLGASTNGVSAKSASAATVTGFGVHSRETLSRRKHERRACKCCTSQRIWRTLTWNTGCLGASTTVVSANAALVSGFGMHHCETLSWRQCQRSFCKCRTCQRISCTWHTLT